MFEVDLSVDFEEIGTVLKKTGLNIGGKTQAFFTNEVIKEQSPYVPYLNGFLDTNVTILPDKDGFIHNSPYSRYHWFGKKMIGPAPKELTDIDMNYNGGPLRGPFWTERMWADKGNEIIRSTEAFMKRGLK